jgi:hypothetical protein
VVNLRGADGQSGAEYSNQGKPWTHEEDSWLRQAFQIGSDIKEMSAALKRPRAEIRARMEKLGLRWEEL